jgi:uncharacterized protein YaaW (UPF0174 family)
MYAMHHSNSSLPMPLAREDNMQNLRDILLKLQAADYLFLSKTIATWFTFNSDKVLQSYVDQFESEPSVENRNKLVDTLEAHIRYLGSSDIAYAVRRIRGVTPGVSFAEIVSDTAKRLKVKLPIAPLNEQLENLVTSVASKRLASMKPDQLEELLTKAGAKEEAKDFLRKHGGALGLSILALIIRMFGKEIAEEIVSTVTANLIARYLGRQLAKRIVTETGKRFPWWSEWFGPIVWIATGVWLAIDLQGPAHRKTVPTVLYLGLCVNRLKSGNGS